MAIGMEMAPPFDDDGWDMDGEFYDLLDEAARTTESISDTND
jgi:hypothetical protein